jgi:hypothetical protein
MVTLSAVRLLSPPAAASYPIYRTVHFYRSRSSGTFIQIDTSITASVPGVLQSVIENNVAPELLGLFTETLALY